MENYVMMTGVAVMIMNHGSYEYYLLNESKNKLLTLWSAGARNKCKGWEMIIYPMI